MSRSRASNQSPYRRGRPHWSEDGLTLVELLVVLVIMPVIIGAIADVVITSLKDQSSVGGRLSDSASAQLSSAYYVRDVESATFATTNPAATSPSHCGVGHTVTTGLQPILGLSWGSPNAGGTVVSYWYGPEQGTNPATDEVLRLYCTGGSTSPSSVVKVAHGVAVTSGIDAAVAPASLSTATGSSWTSTIGMSGITLSALESTSTYHFDLLGVPRVSTAQGNGGNPLPPPFLLLGSGTDVLGCNGRNGSVDVNGTAYINSVSNNSVDLGNSSLTATQIYTADNPASGSFSVGPHGSYSPSPPQSGPQIPDPYAGLTPPTGVAAPPPTVVSNASGGNTTTYYPGIYSTGLQLSGTWKDTAVLSTGVYILQGDFSTSGQINLQSGPGGALVYVSKGSISITGGGSVTLNPMAPPPYPSAPNLVIWQDKADTNTIEVAGSGGVHTISGTIYAPTAQVGGTGNGNYTVGAIIAAKFGCDGNGSASIG